jgi:hypothetical protein
MMRARPALIASLGALVAFASPAAAAPRPVGPPTTSWSVSKITQGGGSESLGHDTTRARSVRKQFDLGLPGRWPATSNTATARTAPSASASSKPVTRSPPDAVPVKHSEKAH